MVYIYDRVSRARSTRGKPVSPDRHSTSPERRRKAVLDVLGGRPVSEVARIHGVSRQTVHTWLRRYLDNGETGLLNRSRRPHLSPTRLDPSVEQLICTLRRDHARWGARRLLEELARRGTSPLPSQSTVHRVLVRNRLVRVRSVAGAPADTASDRTPVPDSEPSATEILELKDSVRELMARLTSVLQILDCDLWAAAAPTGQRPSALPEYWRLAPMPTVRLFECPVEPVSRLS